MGSRRKEREARAREKLREARAKEKALQDAADAEMRAYMKRRKAEFTPLGRRQPNTDVRLSMDLTRGIPSACDKDIVRAAVEAPVELEGDMAQREAAAQQEAERRKRMVAPLANKMGYVYIGEFPPEIIEGLGRKL